MLLPLVTLSVSEILSSLLGFQRGCFIRVYRKYSRVVIMSPSFLISSRFIPVKYEDCSRSVFVKYLEYDPNLEVDER